MAYKNRTTGEIISDADYDTRFGFKTQGPVGQLPVQQTITPEEFQVPGILGKIGRFLGPEKLGRRIGAGLAKYGPGGAEHRQALATVKEAEEKGFYAPGTTRTLETGGVTGIEALGSALQTGLSTALPFAGKALGVGRGLLTQMPRSAALGSAFGVAGALERGKPEELYSSAIQGALIGAPLPLLGAAFAKVGTVIKGFPITLAKRVFPTTKKDILSGAEAKAFGLTENPVLAKEVIDRGLLGSYEGMLTTSIRRISEFEAQIQQVLKTPGLKIVYNKRRLNAALKAATTGYKEGLLTRQAKEGTKLVAELNRVKGNKIPINIGLRTRRFLDNARSHSSFKLNTKLSPKQGGLKEITDEMRGAIANTSPELKNFLNEERIYITARDGLIDKLYAEQNKKIISFVDALLGGGGMMAGAPGVGLGAMVAIRAFQQPSVLMSMARGLTGITKPVTRTLETQLPRQLGQVGPEVGKAVRQLIYPMAGK